MPGEGSGYSGGVVNLLRFWRPPVCRFMVQREEKAESFPGGGHSSWTSQTGRQGTIAPELPSWVNVVGAEEEHQVCSLMWCPGQVVTRVNTMVMTITPVCKGFTLVCVYIWAVRPSLNYTGHGHCLSLELDMFHLFLTEHSLPRGFLGHKDIGLFSSFVSWGMLFQLLVWFVFPALFPGLFCEFVSARGRASDLPSGWDVTLKTAALTWISWPYLPKGLCFAEDILKVPTLSFQIPKGYLKWNKKQEFSSLVL